MIESLKMQIRAELSAHFGVGHGALSIRAGIPLRLCISSGCKNCQGCIYQRELIASSGSILPGVIMGFSVGLVHPFLKEARNKNPPKFRESLTLGNLSAALSNAGINCRSIDAELQFVGANDIAGLVSENSIVEPAARIRNPTPRDTMLGLTFRSSDGVVRNARPSRSTQLMKPVPATRSSQPAQ
jgi:hypothetical protein